MIVWISLAIYILLVRLFMGKLTDARSKKNFLFLAGVAVFLIMGLRGSGYENIYDLNVYKDFYESMGNTDWEYILDNTPFEYGYTILNKFLYTFFPFPQFIIIFSSGFCVFSVCRFIYLNSEDVFYSFLFYVTLGSMGFMLTGLRQAIAICLCLYAVEHVKKEKLIKFLCVTILAATIHKSALIFLPFYFISNIKRIKRSRWSIVLITSVVFAFIPFILKFGKFLTQGELMSSEEAQYSFNGIVPILLYLIGLFAQFYLYHNNDENDNKIADISIMLSLGLGLYFMRFYNMALERLALYYTQASYICLVNFFGVFKKDKLLMLMKFFAIVLAMLLFVKRLQTAGYADYSFFWN